MTKCTRYLVLGFDVEKRDGAIASFERSANAIPSRRRSFFCFAKIHTAAGNLDRARDLMRDLVTSNPDNPQYLAITSAACCKAATTPAGRRSTSKS